MTNSFENYDTIFDSITSADARTIWKVLEYHTEENFHKECDRIAAGFFWMIKRFDDPKECRRVMASFGYFEKDFGIYGYSDSDSDSDSDEDSDE